MPNADGQITRHPTQCDTLTLAGFLEGVVRVRDPSALRSYLRLLGLSERALAVRAGVGHATVNHLVSGRRASCSERTAVAIEAALDCPRGLFFEPASSISARSP